MTLPSFVLSVRAKDSTGKNKDGKPYRYLDEEWEATAEVLNSKEAIQEFLKPW